MQETKNRQKGPLISTMYKRLDCLLSPPATSTALLRCHSLVVSRPVEIRWANERALNPENPLGIPFLTHAWDSTNKITRDVEYRFGWWSWLGQRLSIWRRSG